MDLFKKLRYIFGKKDKKEFILLSFLMLGGALFETLGIGLIVPLVNIIITPEIINDNDTIYSLYSSLNFGSQAGFFIFACSLLLIVYILKNIYLLLMYIVQYRIVYNQQAGMSIRLLGFYMRMPYVYHLRHNSAELLRNVNTEVSRLFSSVVIPLCTLISESMVTTCVLALLVLVEPLATLMAAAFLLVSVSLFFRIFRKKVSQLGQEQQYYSGQMIKWINQSLGAIKEVKVAGKEDYFVNTFAQQIRGYIIPARYIQVLNQLPRLVIETIAVGAILLIIIGILLRGAEARSFLPVLGLFAMAAFRLMPSFGRIVASTTQIRYCKPAVDVIYNDLGLTGDNHAGSSEPTVDAGFIDNNAHSIQLKNVWYRYPEAEEWVSTDINLEIPLGEATAFIGSSGAGKTTLVDIILGLLRPVKGQVLLGKEDVFENLPAWQKKLGYIPQNIYLSDDSIKRNVAFGIEDENIDESRVWKALELAQLKSFIERMPEKLDSFVGERGVRLSGGQRQRIGIARALYHDPPILVLDEATSSLDSETEREIMKSIDQLKGEKTLIIVSHRLSTVQNCDNMYKVDNGIFRVETSHEERMKPADEIPDPQ